MSYGIKQKEGFFAYQGNQCWNQDEIIGWAEYCSKEDAEQAALRFNLKNYEIVAKAEGEAE